MNLELATILHELRADIRKLSSPWLNRQEAAGYLKCDPSMINKLVNAGKLTKYGLGTDPRFKREDLDALIVRITA